MAVARGSKKWTRGLIASLSEEEHNRSFLRSVLGKEFERPAKLCNSSWKIPRSKNIVRRRSLRFLSKRKSNIRAPSSSVLAGTLVEKRTQVLKRLVPGGESMDGFSSLDDTLDYVTSSSVGNGGKLVFHKERPPEKAQQEANAHTVAWEERVLCRK
ncbi:hypothetical protein GW17_00050470 [Ensete ventricosum]|nr:hypothetical protein GW17_00050470 [Ensete ventricosum]